MIYIDVTKSARWGHSSGLGRVTRRLVEELGAAATPVRWVGGSRSWVCAEGGKKVIFSAQDWLLTAEVFAPDERKGWEEWVGARSCKIAAIYHDAIPLKHPEITWPQSVARHGAYMSMLHGWDRVWAVSQASCDELSAYWRWQGREVRAVELLKLGADFQRGVARAKIEDLRLPLLLSVGILEPRKNQRLLLKVAEALSARGMAYELHLVGRVNKYFGAEILREIKTLRKKGLPIFHHVGLSDAELGELYSRARVSLFPTIAEGCGLPLLESLWRGVPCIASDLAVLRENALGGGATLLPVNDAERWAVEILRLLSDDSKWKNLVNEAASRPLPTWAEAAVAIRAALA